SQGIFVGAGGGIPALRGQFSGSVAIAGMKGKWKDDNGFSNTADTTFGFSLGGAYTYPITPALGVTADLRYQQYKYNFDVVAGTMIVDFFFSPSFCLLAASSNRVLSNSSMRWRAGSAY